MVLINEAAISIEEIKAFISTCPALEENAMIYTDFTDSEPVNYGIRDLGTEVCGRNIIGKRSFKHEFAFHMRLWGEQEENRIENNHKIHMFFNWLNAQSDVKSFPIPNKRIRILKIEAFKPRMMNYDGSTGAGLNFDGSTNTGIYSVQFFIYYEEQ